MQQVPLAILTCRANSHPFQERQISAQESVKVGRSVARVRPTQSNAIFDCRVLSRNHALLWYENNKFYLQDSKSSNGTFVNNQRLSKASEESAPHEICSGDTIQFGVDVMENSRTRGEDVVTHSCIIATVQLFHPDGTEARRDVNPFSHMTGVAVQSQDLYQLAQYLQEALHREQMLESKLVTLQRWVECSHEASESGWQALIDEDRLLSKLEVLQNQLQIYSKNQSEDSLRQELTALQEDKYNYENTTKESLRKVLEEKLEAVRKLSELERSLSNQEEECQHLRQMCEKCQTNLEELAQKHQEQQQEMAGMHDKLQEADKLHREEMEALTAEKEDLLAKLDDMVKQDSILQAKVESLQADNDFTKEQLVNMRSKMDSIKESSHDSLRIPELITQGVQVEMVNLLDLQQLTAADSSSEDGGSEKGDSENEIKDSSAKEVADTLASLDLELDQQEEDLDSLNEKELRDTLDGLCQGELSQYSVNSSEGADLSQHALDQSNCSDQNEADDSVSTDLSSSFPDTLRPEKLSETQSNIEQYKKLLRESEAKEQESKAKIKQLHNELQAAKAECHNYAEKIVGLEKSLSDSEVHLSHMLERATENLKAQLEESRKQEMYNSTLMAQLQLQVKELEAELESSRRQLDSSEKEPEKQEPSKEMAEIQGSSKSDGEHETTLEQQLDKMKDQLLDLQASLDYRQCENSLLKELLQESRAEQNVKDSELSSLKERLQSADDLVKKKETEVASLRQEMTRISEELKVKATTVTRLQDQLDRAELSTREVKEHILILRDRIVVEEGEHSKAQQLQEAAFQQALEESQQTAREAQKEAQTLRERVDRLQNHLNATVTPTVSIELASASTESVETLTLGDASAEATSQPAQTNADDFVALKEECNNLRKRVQALEETMQKYKEQPSDTSSLLEESMAEVSAIKDSLALQESVCCRNLTDTQKDEDRARVMLSEAEEEIVRLKSDCSNYLEQINILQDKCCHLDEDYDQLAFRSKMVSTCSLMPLVVLLFALIVAFNPILSVITATTSPR